jgi:hypothetical protein
MVEFLNLKNWIILPFLCFGFVLIAWICPTCAAQLKDIRVGEYETHTRIVFEFSGPDSQEKISPLESGLLTVIFPDTDLSLIRKIPIDQSNRLKEIKIWQRHNELSLVLSFAFEHFRYELSKLSKPKRIVLDVFQLTAPEPSEHTVSAKAANNLPETAAEKQPVADRSEPLPASDIEPTSAEEMSARSASDQLDSAQEQTQEPVGQDAAPSNARDTPLKQNSATASSLATAPAPAVELPKQIQGSELPPDRPVGKKKLQHYLAVALVILTLIILLLLLIMLVSKSHWANANTRIQPSEFIERQDERIAAIDAKIREQFKRFDKA